MRFVHISDSHLGAATLGKKIAPSGANQREEDICNSFISAIDKIIELKPDFVLHTGDLFHSVRPTNRIIHLGLQQFIRLSEAEIPVVIISGNHDTPKQRSIGSVFRIFELFSGIYAIYKDRYETVQIKDAIVHAIPHCAGMGTFQEELKKIKIDPQAKYNILMLHGVIAGIPEFSMGELSEQEIPSSHFELGFDYVALGHYHRNCEVKPNVWYAGSTERLSMAELSQEKGFLEVDLSLSSPDPKNSRTDFQSVHLKFHRVPTRVMIELPSIDASALGEVDPDKIHQEIERRIGSENIGEKIVRLKVTGIPPHVYNSLDFRAIVELKSKAFYFDLRLEKVENSRGVSQYGPARPSIGKLNLEFEEYLKNIAIEGLDKDKLKELGLKYLTEKMTDDE
jgi:DNA repair protein SbcD/Mre11